MEELLEERRRVHVAVPERRQQVAGVEGVVKALEEVVLHHVEVGGAVLVRLVQQAGVAREARVTDQGGNAGSRVSVVRRPLGRVFSFDGGTDGDQGGFGQEVVDEGGEVGFGVDEFGDEAAALVGDVRYDEGVHVLPIAAWSMKVSVRLCVEGSTGTLPLLNATAGRSWISFPSSEGPTPVGRICRIRHILQLREVAEDFVQRAFTIPLPFERRILHDRLPEQRVLLPSVQQ